MISCKESVRFSILRPQIWGIFDKLDEAFSAYQKLCIVTCGTDGHPQDDPHTNGFALDLRSKHLSDEQRHAVLHALRVSLGSTYTVLLENEGMDNEHYHIQVRKELWRSML